MSTDSDRNDGGVDVNEQGLSRPLRRWRAVGDLDDARRIQWRAVRAAERVMYDPQATRSEVLNAVTRITQAVRCYLAVIEAAELEARVAALEELLQTRNGHRV